MDRNIEALLSEDRVFEPPPGFREQAVAGDPEIYDRANRDHEAFWVEQAQQLTWTRPWDTVMEWNAPWVTWFAGGQLNASANCLDRHVEAGGGDKVAFYWEGEPGDTRVITYRELLDEVSKLANALRSLGVGKGDRVNIYLGMVPELPIAMLACARIGAPHSVVFGGFSAEALRDRINDAEAKVLITADGAWRRGAVVPLKDNADVAVAECPSIEHVITVRRCGNEHAFTEGRDHWYHELLADQSTDCPPEPMDAEDLLYLLYTSGTTGKPKGIAHTTGGYMTQVAATHRMIFDIHDDDVYWCAADCGWVTGHSYIVYGPLANHTTGVLYEGAPDWPDKDRWWAIIESTRDHPLHRADGDPRVHAVGHRVAREARHVVAAAAGFRGRTDQPGGVGLVLEGDRRRTVPGRRHLVADRDRRDHDHAAARSHHVEARVGHVPVPGDRARHRRRARDVRRGRRRWVPRVRHPWPSIARTIWGDPDRYIETYFSKYGPETYVAGDGARRDDDGYFWLLGRIDDVMNVAGHRLSTFEIESALVDDDRSPRRPSCRSPTTSRARGSSRS